MFVGRNLIAGQWREGAGVNQEEMFSQTTCVLAVGDLDEAITGANDTPGFPDRGFVKGRTRRWNRAALQFRVRDGGLF